MCKVLREAYNNLPKNMSLLDMIMKINRIVSDDDQQFPDPRIHLKGKINFTPKNVSDLFIFSSKM